MSQKEAQQKRKDQAQAAKDRELNNRPPRVVTRTVTQPAPAGITHVGFSGGNFSSDEIHGLAGKLFDIQGLPNVQFTDPTERQRVILSRILAYDVVPVSGWKKQVVVFPSLDRSVNEDSVSYQLRIFKEWGIVYSPGDTVVDEGSASITSDPRYKVFELTTPTDITGLGLSDKFSYKLFKGEVDTNNDNTNDAKFHAEIATDYDSDDTDDYVDFGWWIQIPKQASRLNDYNLGVLIKTDHHYANSSWNALTGSATYTGSMMGLHAEIESNGKHLLSRLTGNVSLTADFGTNSAGGNLTGTFSNLKLNGAAATGSITFERDLEDAAMGSEFLEGGQNLITINNNNYKGIVTFAWLSAVDGGGASVKPNGVMGTIQGITEDGTKSFVAAYGAREE